MAFHIDLNVTSICNLACSYCSEGNECGLSSLYLQNTKVSVKDFIDKSSKIPGEKKINFWGGEPFINWKICKDVINGYKDNPEISFFFYTNGILIKDYIEELKEFHKELGDNRFVIQVSYDGKYLTDTIRVDKTGKGTAERVVEAYKLLKENGIPVSLKSVISTEAIPHLYESFVEIQKLQGYYNPTPDIYSDTSETEYDKYLDIIEDQLTKISKYIYDNDLNPDSFSWFKKSRATCSAGGEMCGVDLTGEVFPCHGCFYGDSREQSKIGTFEVFEGEIQDVRDKFRKLNSYENTPDQCKTCNVNFCMNCQSANLSKSNKETFDERWRDNPSNWQVCKLFKFNDKFNKTIRYAMQEKAKGKNE